MADKRWKPRRQDAWATCEAVSGNCHCLRTGTGPCLSWIPHLIDCHMHGLDPLETEVHRLRYNRKMNTLHRYGSNCG